MLCYIQMSSVIYLIKKLSYRRDSAGRQSLRHLRPFMVIDFGTNQKPVCATCYYIVNNINLHPVSHHFRVTAQWQSNYCLGLVVPILNAFILGNLCE